MQPREMGVRPKVSGVELGLPGQRLFHLCLEAASHSGCDRDCGRAPALGVLSLLTRRLSALCPPLPRWGFGRLGGNPPTCWARRAPYWTILNAHGKLKIWGEGSPTHLMLLTISVLPPRMLGPELRA